MSKPWEHLPIYKKADEIRTLVDSIVEIAIESIMNYSTEEEGKMIDDSINYLVDNSILIPAKIAEVSHDDALYDQQMESATLIRKAAKELLADAKTLQDFGFKETEYLDVLRTEVEAFRVLFLEWIDTFDPWNYVTDNWGLFNPPNIDFDDDDLDDDDLPFDFDDSDDDLF